MSDAATDRKAKSQAADREYKAAKDKTKAAETGIRLAKLAPPPLVDPELIPSDSTKPTLS